LAQQLPLKHLEKHILKRRAYFVREKLVDMSTPTSGAAEGTVSVTDQAGERGMEALQSVERAFDTAGRWTWKFFHKLPGHGALIGGAVGLGAVMLIGVAETATACFTAYVTYRVFAYGESFTEAIENTIKFEKGDLAKEEREKIVLK
jgi:hypothetical protein